MNVIRDVVKIIKQIRGEENIFRYQSTEVNQLYLLYVISSKIFTTEYLHWETKCFWITSNLTGLVIGYGASILCLCYGDESDLLLILYAGFVTSIITYAACLIPFGMHWYSSEIETMLDRMDEIITRRTLTLINQNRKARSTKNIVTANASLSFISYIIFNLVCTFDIMFFYKPQKVKNYTYYLIPLPKLEEYGSKTIFFIMNTLELYGTFLLIMALFAELQFFNMWARICNNEAIHICDDIVIASKEYEKHYSENQMTISTNEKLLIDRGLLRKLIAGLKGLEDIKSLINCQKQHFEILSTFVIITMFICELAHSYVLLVIDLDPAVKAKEVSVYISTAGIVWIVCQIGEALDDISAHTSFSIYCTPWYSMSPQYRSDIFQILCQTQESTSVKLSSIYPVNMNYFIRWMNLVYSTTNVLATTVE